jgi:adenosylcobinamide-GDP ribazoletransferase
MSSPLDPFLSVLSLTCRIRVPAPAEPDYSRADFFLPLTGVFAGLAALGGWGLGSLIFPGPWLPALSALAAQYLAFNLFHLDGLADTADAGLALAGPERRLEILKDPRVGVYGLFTAFLALTTRTAALAALGGRPGFSAVLLAAPVAGRFAAALVPLAAQPARPDGLGAKMRDFSPPAVAAGLLAGLAPAFLAALAGLPGEGSVLAGILGIGVGSLAAGLAAGLGAAIFYRRRFGGFTGDALGAAVELGELAFLLGACAAMGRSGGA